MVLMSFKFPKKRKMNMEHFVSWRALIRCLAHIVGSMVLGGPWAQWRSTPKLIAIGLYWFLHTIRSAYHILYLNFRPPNPITGQRWLRNKSPNSAHWALEVWWALHRVKSRVHAISPVSIDRIIFIKTNFTSWMDHSNPMILDFINDSFFWQCTHAHEWSLLCHLTPTL